MQVVKALESWVQGPSTKDHPSEDTGAETPSRAPVGATEARGRCSRDRKPDKKRASKALESWVQGPSTKTERPAMKATSLKKRVREDTQPRKEAFKDIRYWFETKGLAQEKEKPRKDLKKDSEEEPTRKEPSGGKAK